MFKLTNDPILQTNDPVLQTPGFEIILVKDFDAHYDFETRTIRNSVVCSFRCFIYSQVHLFINIRDF